MNRMKPMQTRRLLLRPWCMEDLEDFYAYAKDPEIGPNAGWKPHSSLDESREILKSFVGNEEVNAIVLRENGRVVGSLGLHPDRLSHEGMGPCREVGYVLARDCWGRGLMTEAVKRAQRYAFEEIGLALLSVAHFPFNTRSGRVIAKSGFRYEKTLQGSYIDYRGVKMDEVCYLMTREEYFTRRDRANGLFCRPGLTEEEARAVCSWRYAGEYARYDMPEWDAAVAGGWAITKPEVRESQYWAVLDSAGELYAFFRFRETESGMTVGLGVNPESCGNGSGRQVMELILDSFRQKYPGMPLELDVQDWNRRAVSCYESAGFVIADHHFMKTHLGEAMYYRMRYTPGER